MTHNFKPGDVAISRYGVVFKTERGWYFDDGSGPNGPEAESYPPADLRPLVVIDPENREQVEAFTHLFLSHYWGDSDAQTHTDAGQAALREFANPTPPRPEEPTGLGAVVEDAEGKRWVRNESRDDCPWRCAIDLCWLPYSEIAAVTVLSEGVTP